jgi:hypothetical protein
MPFTLPVDPNLWDFWNEDHCWSKCDKDRAYRISEDNADEWLCALPPAAQSGWSFVQGEAWGHLPDGTPTYICVRYVNDEYYAFIGTIEQWRSFVPGEIIEPASSPWWPGDPRYLIGWDELSLGRLRLGPDPYEARTSRRITVESDPVIRDGDLFLFQGIPVKVSYVSQLDLVHAYSISNKKMSYLGRPPMIREFKKILTSHPGVYRLTPS